jgi:hypothetical protein
LLIYREGLARIHAHAPAWRLISVTDVTIDQSIRSILVHNINASDAIHLQTALMLRGAIQTAGHELVFVCADKRLLRAAWAPVKVSGLIQARNEKAAG